MVTTLQFGGNTSSVVTLAYFVLLIVFVVFGQQLQYFISIGGVSRSLVRLESAKDEATRKTRDVLAGGRPPESVEKRLAKLIEYVTIMPESLDPGGVVPKIELVVRSSDVRTRAEVKEMMGVDDPVKVSVGQNLVEVTSSLTVIYKVVRHYYLTSRRTRSYFTLVQLQASLPQISEMAEALRSSVDSIAKAQPIGDGLGPLAASRLSAGVPKERVARDTVLSRREFRGRTLYVVKAEGPMGYVGEPDVAIRKVVEEMGVSLNAIVMADAALKLEGEETGELVEGMGAAIGGIGTEKFRIEEVAARNSIPIYAILVKESQAEALTVMRERIADASESVLDSLAAIVDTKTNEGDSVLFAGVGNTLGIGQ